MRRIGAGGWTGLLVLALAGARADAGSYMHSEDELYYRASLGVTTATETWDEHGDLDDIGCTSQRTSFSHQVEYGYSYYYNLLGRIGLSDSRCGDRQRSGLGDLVLGVRGRLNPYMNFRSWELDVTIPLHRQEGGRARVGCGAFGLGASVDRSDRPSPFLTVSYGAALKLWEAPLAHQARLAGQFSGPVGRRGDSRWAWQLGADIELPLEDDGPVDPLAAVDDCGTQARALRGHTGLRYRYGEGISLSCGVSAALIGEDVSRSRGFSCAVSRLWD